MADASANRSASPRRTAAARAARGARKLEGVLFDMDGVVTDTAEAHAVAWKQLFDAYLERRAKERGEEFRLVGRGVPPAWGRGGPVLGTGMSPRAAGRWHSGERRRAGQPPRHSGPDRAPATGGTRPAPARRPRAPDAAWPAARGPW